MNKKVTTLNQDLTDGSRGDAETLRDEAAVANRGGGEKIEDGGQKTEGGGESALVENRDGKEKKYKWVLGNPPSGKHCSVCLARAGKVKTAKEWAAMKAPPCNCHCSLKEVDDETANRWSNIARAASLAVRQAKAARRERGQRTEDGGRRTEDGDAETQRKQAAREAVKRELAERRVRRTGETANWRLLRHAYSGMESRLRLGLGACAMAKC